MKSIHIRDVPDDTLQALKRLARSNFRSLQGELHDILEKASRRAPSPDAGDDALDLVIVRTGTGSTWRREEIYGDSGR